MTLQNTPDALGFVAALAREQGIGRLSLSVGRKNFAHQLYLSEGYQIMDETRMIVPAVRVQPVR